MKKVVKKNSAKKPLIIAAVCTGVATVAVALGKAFKSMKASAKAQHEVDKANFEAVKAESKANWEEAKAMGKPSTREAMMQAQRDEQIKEANERKAEAEARIAAAQQK
ncbi:MAG: hypothetical protein IJW00_05770 [Clostridia bacterium]|nr:hypothetical protein [Clostridia bacterium]